jgi:hypothetical protein
MYRDLASLSSDVQERIKTLIDPKDPEQWVSTPIVALNGQTFLEPIKADGGDVIDRYFADLASFEQSLSGRPPENLGAVFSFDQADLEANRAGRVSDAQRRRLWRLELARLIGFVASTAAGLLLSAALITGADRRYRDVGLAAVLILLGVALAVWSWEAWLDILSGSVESVEGDLRTTQDVTVGRYGSTTYCFAVNGRKFPVPKPAWDQVREGRRRVYCLPRTRAILSVEPAA